MNRIRPVVFVVLLGLGSLLVLLVPLVSAPPSGAYAADLPTAVEPAALAPPAPELASDVEAFRPPVGLKVYLGPTPFDPLVGRPELPVNLMAAPSDGPDYWLVQLSGPVLSKWKDELVAQGLRIVNYVPDFTYIGKMDGAAKERIEKLSFVRWVGLYHPGYKIWPDLLKATGKVEVTIGFFPDESADPGVYRLGTLGIRPLDVHPGRPSPVIRAILDVSHLAQVAQVSGVAWIVPYVQPVPGNDIARGIMNAAIPWDTLGLFGLGQVVGVADTGLDTGITTTLSADFAGRLAAAFALGRTSPPDWSDPHGHGTHVAGSVLGNGSLSGSNPATHNYATSSAGVAPEAQLVFQSLLDSGGGLGGVPANYNTLFQQAYDEGARIHTNSWGGPGNDPSQGATDYGRYDTSTSQIDEFLWNHQDFVITWLVHNNGSDSDADGVVDTNRLCVQSAAKNTISVGATESNRGVLGTWGGVNYPVAPINGDGQDDDANGMAAFSSRGPTQDGRIKPDVVMPGTSIVSARSHDPGAGGAGDYTDMSGTSMATPLTAGAATLIRQYYTDTIGHAPSGPLIKATIINGAQNIAPGQYGIGATQEITDAVPNVVEGFGRVNLRGSLCGILQFVDETTGLNTTDTRTYSYTVRSTNEPLKITMTYYDHPGFPASPLGAQLRNDLDMVVTTPSAGTLFPNGLAGADNVNNVEQVVVPTPENGTYVVTISGTNVPFGPQPFALVVNQQMTNLFINSTADTGDGDPGDGICDTGTITVPTGICTLRAAIQEANTTICTATIKFNIPVATDLGCDAGGVCTIQPGSALPVITDTVVIDGYTQPGAAPATGATNAVLKIVLDGSLAGNGVNGLVLQTDDSTIRGLAIHGFRVTNLASYDFSEGNGIVIREGMTNTITGNFIGTNVTGDGCVDAGNGGSGVLIGGLNRDANADNNTVGGTGPEDRNIITCNGFQDQTATGWDGVSIRVNYTTTLGYLSADGNEVLGNYIGTDVTGAMTLTVGTDTFGIQHIGNTGNGVRIAGGSSNVVSGTVGVAPSILSGNELAGVRIEASPVFTREANSNVVQGNYIGTDVNGTADLGNLDVGVYIVGLVDDADNNLVGGTTGTTPGGNCTGACNLISGNGASGMFIFGGLADNNDVMGNYIGTDFDGDAAIPNDSGGINITDAMTNTIGGTTDTARNLVSGNGGVGVSIINSAGDGDAGGNVIQGNYIGTNISGTAALTNTLSGVVITDAANNDVGGTTGTTPGGPCTGACNLISGNGEYGVIIMESGATGNDVQGNYIGTDVNGTAAIPNQGAGVLITNASGNTVGGSGNLISGNVLQGVRLIGADDNTVRDNLIGTQANGASPLGNGSHGVVIADGNNNVIGVDSVFPQDNTIAYNGGDGVFVLSGTGNQILSNSIFTNTELGIDLGTDNDVTPNDDDDPDTGANNLQNFPVLTSASSNGGSTDIGGLLNSTPNTTFSIQFFYSPTCDPSGFGEGQTYLGSVSLGTNASGDATIGVSFSTSDLTGNFITATATDPNGNTSEFSNCIPVPSEPVLGINKEVQDLNGGDPLPGDTLLYTINYSNTGYAPATGVFITDTYSVSCTIISNVTTDLNFTTFFSDTTRIRWPAATGGILLDAQASGSVSYRCTLDDSFPHGTTNVDNTATIDSDQTTPQQAPVTVPVTVAAVLTIDKECTPATGNSPDDTVHCVIQYANTGDAYAAGATILDDYDETAIFSITNFQETGGPIFGTTPHNNGDRLRWPDDTNTVIVPAGASGSVSYDATLQGPGTFLHGTTQVTNTATIDSNDTDPVQDPETIQVEAGVVLTIDKTVQDANDGLAEPGETLTYTINYTNTGDAPAHGVFITDDYSDLCDIINVTDDGDFSSHDDNGDRIRWPDAGGINLAAQASGSVSYECELQDPFPEGTTRVTNTGIIDSNETGPEKDMETLFTACYDFNGNGVVDVGDVMQVAARWLLTAAIPDPDDDPSTPNYEEKYDVDGDGVITVVDIMTVAAQWGQTCPV